MSFIFMCPFCNQKLECDDDLENQTTKCPSCGEEVVPVKENLNHRSIKDHHFAVPMENKQFHERSTILRKIGIILVCAFCIIMSLAMFIINISLKNQIASCKSEEARLRETIAELKFGPERLKGEAIAAINDGDLDKAKKIYDDLFARHPHKKGDPAYKSAFDDIVRKIAKKRENYRPKESSTRSRFTGKYNKKLRSHAVNNLV